MILVYLIVILLTGGVFAWITGRWNRNLPRIISLIAVMADLLITISLIGKDRIAPEKQWVVDYSQNWIPHFGINLHLALDGLSLLLLLLTFFLGTLSILISWKEINDRIGFFHFNLLWTLSGIVGVFLSLDLFLFYFFWELMLVPMYFLIAIWGHENRTYASYKFFLYTQASGLIMFIAILAFYFIHGISTGTYTFDYLLLLGTSMSVSTSTILMLGFLAAFLVKLPVVPLHNWLPDAHAEAPTAGSLILAGLLLKTGAYGLIRFCIPLFPDASVIFAPVGMILGVLGILYGAKLAFAQTDLKRLIAYTSVSHMGFIILGVYAFNKIASQGVVIQILAHGISTGALFIMAGQLMERFHQRDIEQMGGLWAKIPLMGGVALVFCMASLGLPGLGNFIAEFLILSGTFNSNILMACIASIGLILATVYSLRIMQKIFYCKSANDLEISDLNFREKIISASLIIVIVFLGLFPQPIFDIAGPAIDKIIKAKKELIYNPAAETVIKEDLNLQNLENPDLKSFSVTELFKNPRE
jgi:NADH-quinone oxidoreductase subunit M